ncbi:hypothetical protein WKI68_14775 [Streptomyces sp. MS1.HAVA.3]|uniref:Uncharacterized protein n=1 Tax=Streptomyces caledonius TaxID=3134107 RepID=A0ABU8U395_9ACTN
MSEGGSLPGPMALLMKGQALSRSVGGRLLVLTATPDRKNLAALRELVEPGKVTPVIA